MRCSRRARKRSALLSNCEYMTPFEKPASSAMASRVAPVYPLSMKTRRAAARTASRFRSTISVRRNLVGMMRLNTVDIEMSMVFQRDDSDPAGCGTDYRTDVRVAQAGRYPNQLAQFETLANG